MNSVTPALIGVLGALVVAGGAYFAAARRLSGKIATSEAASLWEESKSIRDDYRDRLREADDRVVRLEERIAEAERHANKMARENLELLRKTSGYESMIAELREQVEECRAENEKQRKKIEQLEEGSNDGR